MRTISSHQQNRTVLCGCNIGIWRKFQHRDGAFLQHNRVSQNKRLTKTLLFVSAVAALCWLPYVIVDCLTEVLKVPVPRKVYLSNRPHFLRVYRRDNPRGMLGEHEKSL